MSLLSNSRHIFNLFKASNFISKLKLIIFILTTIISYVINYNIKYSPFLEIGKIKFHIAFRKGDLGVICEILFDKVYQNENDFIPEENFTCLDIGSNIGVVALSWFLNVKSGHIFAVEPHPDTFGRLKENISLNKCEKIITPLNYAVSSRAGVLELAINEVNNMAQVSGEGKSNSTSMIKIASIRIDDIVSKYEIAHIDLLKIDVEGHEVEVLLGAEKALKITDRIILEYHSNELKQKCVEIIEQNNFSFKSYGYILYAAKKIK